MSLRPLFQAAERSHWLLVPGLFFLLLGGAFALLWSGIAETRLSTIMSTSRILGTALMFALMQAYLLAMICYQHRVTQHSMDAVSAIARPEDVHEVRAEMLRIGPVTWCMTLFGAAFGLWQNAYLMDAVRDGEPFTALDVVFVGANCSLWAMVALLLGWRIAVSRRIARLSMAMQLDLYRLDLLRPLARIATTDVLIIAGALALLPLQSLDAEFRIWNYQWGLIIGVPAVVVLFLLPLWGLRGRIAALKAERVQTLRAQLAQLQPDNVEQLEVHSAHIDRIASLPTWPIDLRVVTRIFVYLIIPPLAWVASALVENLVDGL
ncbi:MAG: hypothetical protein AB8B93_05665 [Pseudomonadales bacterium]